MRIVSGDLRGRKFPSKLPTGIRPTTDKTREAIFNILNNYIEFKDRNVMDICAGTGALGFESLSRYAAFCLFIEKISRTSMYIKSTARHFNLPDYKYDIVIGDATKVLPDLDRIVGSKKFGLVFIDPPYDLNLNGQIIDILLKSEVLNDDALIVSESSAASSFIVPNELNIISEKIFASTKVTFYELK